ncbi:MAG TPA: NADPH-dependent assimilatory sulfite reductase hemoprotein subunit [Bryobacteraceae bacterium]|jgi:sulfite reductase (ferredoxin)|nr:NADPH-dependent assimilatory sulfite reductase hemoprotein subunit [Bryobacteraceae bacterium]
MDKATPVSAADTAKAASHYLRGTLPEELAQDEPAFSTPAIGVLKFHGIYQQDDRDLRKAGVKQVTAMVRVGVPGGVLTSDQYLALDRLADMGEGSLRITTRQDIQYHYVPKVRLRELIRTLNENWLSTLAACGDVVRNVVSCPAPFDNEQRRDLFPYVSFISKSLKPKTNSYYEIWIDGEKTISAEDPEGEVEPLYGRTYLPRKFKINFAFPGDNTTDLYANDIGIVPHYEEGEITGFTILAGGGMGQSAGVKASHPRLADPICSIGPSREELLSVCEAIVSIHRDFGNRINRKLARLKYVLDAWGVDKFKQELEQRVGYPLNPPRTLTWNRVEDYLGWHRQGVDAAGNPIWFLGVRVLSGRVKDFDAERRVRTGLRTVVERYRPGVRLTAQQNLYLSGIADADRPVIASLLAAHGVVSEPQTLPPILRYAMACPALPTCGQALTESERIMPQVVAEIQAELNEAGLGDEVIHLRTTGCPNGCARPYTAEIGIVGASVDLYTIYLGASRMGTRLGSAFATNVKRNQIVGRLRPVFAHYREARLSDETFGDFCHRLGMDALRELSQMAAA